MSTTTSRRGSTTLAQIIAIESGTKSRTDTVFTNAYHTLQKPAPLSGITRTYNPVDDDGERMPPEATQVQVHVNDVIADVAVALTRAFDVTATKDTANCVAKADVIVDGEVLLAQVPLTFLLTLEKKLVDIRTFFLKLPVLDIAEQWQIDPLAGVYATPVSETARTKKIPRNHVRAEATDKHPAQVDIFTEDVVVGYWSTVKYSGAIPTVRRARLVKKVETLIDAVKFAREAANTITVTDVEYGGQIFDYLLA